MLATGKWAPVWMLHERTAIVGKMWLLWPKQALLRSRSMPQMRCRSVVLPLISAPCASDEGVWRDTHALPVLHILDA